MPSRKPTLALTTPKSATFPADALLPAEALKSAASVRTPHSALSATWRESLASAGLPSAGLPSAGLHSPIVLIKTEDGLLKTPITPPLAYMDFLKLASPVLPSPGANFTSAPKKLPVVEAAAAAAAATASAANTAAAADNAATPTVAPSTAPTVTVSTASTASTTAASVPSAPSFSPSATPSAVDSDDSPSTTPSTAASTATDCSCECERAHKSPRVARIDTSVPPSPFNRYPMSAPATGRTTFPSLAIPLSPALASARGVAWADSPVRSPFSAASGAASPFDWESALKARYAEAKPSAHHAHGCAKSSSTSATSASTTTAPAASARTSIRHIREVVTRTVTYTPRMHPAPKGKKRKAAQCDAAC